MAAAAAAAAADLEDARAAESALVKLALALLLHRDSLEPLLLHLPAARQGATASREQGAQDIHYGSSADARDISVEEEGTRARE